MPELEFLLAYFTSPFAISVLAGSYGLLGWGFVRFRLDRDPASRSHRLTLMFAITLFLWLFVAGSIAACELLDIVYPAYTLSEVKFAVGGATIFAIAAMLPVARLVAKLAPRVLLTKIGEGKSPSAEVLGLFALARARAGVPAAELVVVERTPPIALSVGGRDGKVIVSTGTLALLDSHELETVLAHELSHLRHGDSHRRALAYGYGRLLAFDPLLRLVEAAFHRERELWADHAAARRTGKPAALASALLKLHEVAHASLPGMASPLSIYGRGGGLLSRHPPLRQRVERLLRMAEAAALPLG
jgi:heat shock protein HtpX